MVEWLDIVHRRDNNVKLVFKQAPVQSLKYNLRLTD